MFIFQNVLFSPALSLPSPDVFLLQAAGKNNLQNNLGAAFCSNWIREKLAQGNSRMRLLVLEPIVPFRSFFSSLIKMTWFLTFCIPQRLQFLSIKGSSVHSSEPCSCCVLV